ncbi:hypothetical protein D3C83_34230 [compost metagenome]
MPASFTTLAHLAISALTNALNSSGDHGENFAPRLASRFSMSGACMTRTTSPFNFKTTSRGVPAGAKKPIQFVTE